MVNEAKRQADMIHRRIVAYRLEIDNTPIPMVEINSWMNPYYSDDTAYDPPKFFFALENLNIGPDNHIFTSSEMPCEDYTGWIYGNTGVMRIYAKEKQFSR